MKYVDFYERLASFGWVIGFSLLALAVIISLAWRLLEWFESRPAVIGTRSRYVPFWIRWFRRV